MPVELTWDGKYNADGTKKSPLRVELPFQTVETVNESAQERQKTFDMFSTGRPSEWRNRLIWGDKKYVLPSLLPEFAGKVDLIYIDPPFDTGANFSFNIEIDGQEFTKEPSIIERKAYRDTWGKGIDSYLQWFQDTILVLYDLLSEKGVIYTHLDWHVSYYAKYVLDSIFGSSNFVNEIIWHYKTFQGQTSRYFAKKHDNIFIYRKSSSFFYKEQFDTNFEDTIDSKRWANYLNERYQIVGDKMPTQDSRFLRYLNRWIRENGREPKASDVIYEALGQPVDSVWDLKGLDPKSFEKVDYPTQKPEALLERIINASSEEGSLILDCFCGSGTTAAVAEKLGRRWITCDIGRFAIHTARKRLLGIQGVKPFVVQNLGKYERQLWQAEEFGSNAEQRLYDYNRFVVDLYKAQQLTGYAWLHGVKTGRVIHVGSVDSPVTVADVRSIIREWRVSLGRSGAASNGIDILGWEFAFEINETAKQMAQESGVDLKFLTIPREVLEKKAVEQGDIQFFELAALFIDTQVKGRELTLELTNFIAPLEYVPQEVRTKITKWSSWIDYWAVDFNFRDDTFHNEWQSYRTRKDKTLATKVSHTYDTPGTYQVQVKVIDVMGNDTTRTVNITVR